MNNREEQDFSTKIGLSLSKDRHALNNQLKKLKRPAGGKKAQLLATLEDKINTSHKQVQSRRDSVPELKYPSQLPISEKTEDIVSTIRHNQVIVITGETGSGKTTQIPKICLESGRGVSGKIACTQPRRIAATSLAKQVAKELNTDLGDLVGYEIRFDKKSKPETLVEFLTDGILLTKIQCDRYLSSYDTIIIDEAHERTLNIDFLLGYLRQILLKRRDLKLIITSATIDIEKFSKAFPQFHHARDKQYYLAHPNHSPKEAELRSAPIIEVSGRMYPVEVRYHPIDEILEDQGEISMTSMLQEAIEEILTESPTGDILIFLSGIQEIKEATDQLKFLLNEGFEVLPLFSRLSSGEQNRVFHTGPKRKIILATNIAETSITIPRIHYVIDSGRARISQYNTRSGTQGLPITRISQSSANQRKGRCGRVASGICIRLYTEADFLSRDTYSAPEIQRSDLSEVILRMIHLKLGDIDTFPFIDPPETAQIKAGYRTLRELGALTDTKHLSPIGHQMARLPVDPRTARMIIQANNENVLHPVLIVASAISCQDPREYPDDKKTQARQKHARFNSKESDLLTLLNLWEHYHDRWNELKTQNKMRKFCKQNFLSYRKMREWRDIHNQLLNIAQDNRWRSSRPAMLDQDALHRSILAGYLSHIAKKKEKKLYQSTKNRELVLFPGSDQYRSNHEWIVAIEIIETSGLFAHRVAKIDPDWLEALGGDLCRKTWTMPRWDQNNSRVIANETVTLFGFKIVENRTVNYGKTNINESTEVFIREALVEGNFNGRFPFWKHNRQLIESIRKKEDKTRKRNLLVDDSTIEKFYRARIKEVSCVQDLQKLINQHSGDQFLFLTEKDLLHQEPENTESLYPEVFKIGDKKCQLKYQFNPGHEDDGVTIYLPWKLLNNVHEESFEYLVPGLLLDKIEWLLKNLSKNLRKKLVPVSEKARLVWEDMTAFKYSSDPDSFAKTTAKEFYKNLSDTLFEITRVYIAPEDWNRQDLPPFLRMNFSMIDPKTHEVRFSRHLNELRGEEKKQQDDWNSLVSSLEHYHVLDWNFPNLIEKVLLADRGNVALWGYRTLIKENDGLKITLSKTRKEAKDKSLRALPYLLELKLGADFGWIHEELRFSEDTLLLFQNLWKGSKTLAIEALKKKLGGSNNKLYRRFHNQVRDHAFDMIRAGLLGYQGSPMWIQNAFNKRAEACRKEMSGLAQRVVTWIDATLKLRQEILIMLASRHQRQNQWIKCQLQEELDFFLSPKCLNEIPLAQWPHCARILKAYQRRIEKFRVNPDKEKAKWEDIQPFQAKATLLWNDKSTYNIEEFWVLRQLRWMIEELKVSVFAQDLKTPFPISPQRLEKFMQKNKL